MNIYVRKEIKGLIRVLFFLLTAYFAGTIAYDICTNFIGVQTLVSLVFFILSSLLTLSVPCYSRLIKKSKIINSIVLWIISWFFGSLFIFSYHGINNYSRDIFHAEFYWDYGLDLVLRENGTYKATNSDWVAGEISYGSFSLSDTLLICKGLRFGPIKILDTLKYSRNNASLLFELEESCKGIIEGDMKVSLDLLFIE